MPPAADAGLHHRHAHHRVPSAFDIRALAGFLPCQLMVKFRQIFPHPLHQLRLDFLSLPQKKIRRHLHRRIQR
jgi:hypothetical protein